MSIQDAGTVAIIQAIGENLLEPIVIGLVVFFILYGIYRLWKDIS